METSFEGGQGPEGNRATYVDGWMDGWMDGSCIRIPSAYVLPLMDRTMHHQASSSQNTTRKIIVPYI